MFGINFWEIMVILLVALLVLGPQQLIQTARVIGRLFGRWQQLLANLKQQIFAEADKNENTASRESDRSDQQSPKNK